MSTRATYLISSMHKSQPTCFYIHYDGNLEGAATYFLAMHQIKNFRGGFAERFFRANACAEFTDSHEKHIDTEYQYTLNHKGWLVVKEEYCAKGNKRQWKVVFTGLWHQFVNQYFPDLNSEHKLYEFTINVACREYKEIMSIEEAESQVKTLLCEAGYAGLRADWDTRGSLTHQAKSLYAQIEKYKLD